MQNRFLKCLLAFSLLFSLKAFAQLDTWQDINAGFPAINNTQSIKFITNVGTETYAGFAEATTSNIYKFNKVTEIWENFAGAPNQYGIGEVKSSGTKLFTGSTANTIFELNMTTKVWSQVKDASNQNVLVTKWCVLGDKIYTLEGTETAGYYVRVFNTTTKVYTDLGKPATGAPNPLVGENTNKMYDIVALNNGKVYVGYKSKHISTSFPCIYEWNGTIWAYASGGMDLSNTLRNGLGTLDGIFASADGNTFYATAEVAYYKKDNNSTGWFEMGSRSYGDSAPKYATGNYLLGTNSTNVTRYDQNVRTSLGIVPAAVSACPSADNVFFISSPDNGSTFFVYFRIEKGVNCVTNNPAVNLGIYRLKVDNTKPGTVSNLRLDTGTYLGADVASATQNQAAGVGIGTIGKVFSAGTFNSNMSFATPLALTQPTRASATTTASKGKIYRMDALGRVVEKVTVVGNAIYDMDIANINGTDRIAVIGDFGVVILDENLSYLWHSDVVTTTKSRISIADNGKVAAITNTENSTSNGAGAIKLWSATGTLEGTNVSLDNNGRTLTDIEISSAAAHNKVYVAGFVQVSSSLQVASILAFDINNITTFLYKTWGFGAAEVNTSVNPADTRIYRIKTNDTHLFALGESAGGGPGGASILAYNGKDQTTKIANTGTDTYTDGTNSCGSCHITFTCKIDPLDGTVLVGRFIHPRLPTGKTNTHKTDSGALEVDNDGFVYIGAVSAAFIQGRNSLNINGQLAGTYVGEDMVFLMFANDFKTRVIWTPFSKTDAGGKPAGIAAGNGKIAFLGTTSLGTMHTKDAFRTTSANSIADVNNKVTDAYLAVFNKRVWETANLDPSVYPLIPNVTANEPKITLKALISPNPASERGAILEVEFGNKISNATLIITDINGKRVFSKELSNVSGKFVDFVSSENLTNGLYFINIIQNKQYSASLKWIIQR